MRVWKTWNRLIAETFNAYENEPFTKAVSAGLAVLFIVAGLVIATY